MSDIVHLKRELQSRMAQRSGKVSKVLLLDTSGSMEGEPIAELRCISDKFKHSRRFEFNTDVIELKPLQSIGDARGGTNMALAFSYLKQQGVKKAVMITDGEPDSQTMAIKAVEGLTIDIIYIGPDPAPKFLEDLARASGGKYGEASIHMQDQIESKIRGLLEPPKEAIQL